MNTKRNARALLLGLALMTAGGVHLFAENVRVVTPYLGVLSKSHEDSQAGLNLEDTALMKGLYLQWVNPDRFQANVFGYQVSDVIYSTIWGAHAIVDYYFDVTERSKNVVGVGSEIVAMDMDAKDNISPYTSFKLTNNVTVLYARLGRYFYFGPASASFSLMPWTGTELDMTRGEVSMTPGPPGAMDFSTNTVLAITGINAKARLYHMVEIDAKYSAAYDADAYYNRATVMTNVYLTRHWALSYRFHYGETSDGTASYHLGGVAYAF